MEKEKRWIDLKNDELYLDFEDQMEYVEVRRNALADKKDREENIKKIIGEKTPIYLDLASGKYYYPEMAIIEPEVIERAVVTDKHPLVWVPELDAFMHPETEEK